ncbi:MAG: heavy-metal-associated domain-containing protein [Deltaproteobacteria bacterium]|nr:heavy-metal-associated domain-containing protein [Deltaproteobacteria bacterium]
MPTVRVEGMTCRHCVMAVEKALSRVEGVKGVRVDLESGEASFREESPVEMDKIRRAIEEAGYKVG